MVNRLEHPGDGESKGMRASAAVAATIRRRIVQGELSEGQTLLPEQELAAEFGVSRPTLRQAIRVLESESMVTVRRGLRTGPVVKGPDLTAAAEYVGLVLEFRRATVNDVYVAVCELEALCARMLAETGSEDDIAALREALESEHLAHTPEGLWECQHHFHQLVTQRAGMATLDIAIGSLRHVIDLAHRKYLRDVSERPQLRKAVARKSRQAHSELITLIEHGKGTEAEAHWRQHILDTGRRLKEVVAPGSVLDLLDEHLNR